MEMKVRRLTMDCVCAAPAASGFRRFTRTVVRHMQSTYCRPSLFSQSVHVRDVGATWQGVKGRLVILAILRFHVRQLQVGRWHDMLVELLRSSLLVFTPAMVQDVVIDQSCLLSFTRVKIGHPRCRATLAGTTLQIRVQHVVDWPESACSQWSEALGFKVSK